MTYSFLFSLLAHIFIGLLFFVSVPSLQKDVINNETVPLWIDLKNVEIADKTNLPSKSKTKTQVLSQQKKASSKSVHKFEEVKPVQKFEKIDDSAKIVEEKKENHPLPKKVKQKPQMPVKNHPQPKIKPKQEDDGLESLLASVDKMSAKITHEPTNKDDVSDVVSGVLDGFNGGNGVPAGGKPTVSQIDFIATTIRKYWNFNAGIDEIETMVVVLQVALNPDGRVAWVKIENDSRMDENPSFRSVAESAKRAVYLCDKLGDDSPFRILAQKYPASYNEWQKIRLKFNPLDGRIS